MILERAPRKPEPRSMAARARFFTVSSNASDDLSSFDAYREQNARGLRARGSLALIDRGMPHAHLRNVVLDGCVSSTNSLMSHFARHAPSMMPMYTFSRSWSLAYRMVYLF